MMAGPRKLKNQALDLALKRCEPAEPPRRVPLSDQRRAVLTEASNIRAVQRAMIEAGYRDDPCPEQITRAEALEAAAGLIDWVLRTKPVLDLRRKENREAEAAP